jgi:hypothetical protein
MPATSKKVMFVLTSHDRKGDTPSGYYLREATHPHHVLTQGLAVNRRTGLRLRARVQVRSTQRS